MGLFDLFGNKKTQPDSKTVPTNKGFQPNVSPDTLSLEERYGKASLIGYKTGSWVYSIREFQKLKEEGLGEAGIALGQLYQTRDSTEAFSHFMFASDKGLAEGAWGCAALMGHNDVPDINGEDMIWYALCLKAAQKGCCDAMHELGTIYSRLNNYLSAFYWFTLSGYYEHPEGHSDALHLIKKWENEGRPVVDTSKWNENEEKEDGDGKLSENVLLLWEIYTRQKELTQNVVDNMFFGKAMKGSEIIGLFLGHFFEEHAKMDGNAKMAYQLAANSGSISGMKCLGDMQAYGRGCEKDLNKAFSWYRAAAAAQEKVACFIVGQLFRNKPFLAAYWYSVSYRRGYKPALARILQIEIDNETRKEIENAKRLLTPFDKLSIGATVEYVGLRLLVKGEDGLRGHNCMSSREVVELGMDYVKLKDEDGEITMTKKDFNAWYENQDFPSINTKD